ncbi:MAG: His/Gly/Thr/Pro-type tRNA ligase C-terminal domain-containing protein, partial [Ignavibacteriaceae bacterium]|nr:His/Gly/Thr/Pro-type tRNA ligase C-terminal domain-containing protein [Ignavibacteriaceae bacterium]
ERILLACENEKSFTVTEPSIDVYLIRIDNDLESVVSEFAGKLRKENLSVDFDYLQRSVKAQMREANKLNAKYVLFIGGDEFKNGLMNLKSMSTGAEEKVDLNDFGLLITKLK